MKTLRSAVQVCLFLGLLLISTGFASASTVTLSGNVLFSSLDGSAQDSDGLVNGVFTVNGDLVLDGTINCNDDPPLPGNASACPVRIAVSGDLTLLTGSGIFAENRRGGGTGGNIQLTVGGNLTLQGPSGSLPGAIISSSRLTDGAESAGSITLSVHGNVIQAAGSTIAASTPNGAAGTIGITVDGTVEISGLVVSGPSRQVLATKLTGRVLDGGKSNQSGGAILIRSHSSVGPGIRVEGNAIVASQGETSGSQMVLLEACGIEVRGLVASVLKTDGPSQVVLRSGKGLLIDGRDLGGAGTRAGRVRADSADGGSAGFMVDLFSDGDVQVLGPSLASSLSAVSSSPGSQAQRTGGMITAISLNGGLSAAGNAFAAGKPSSGNQGGILDLEAKGNVTLDGAALRAVGDYLSSAPTRKGGSVSARSYQGALSWTFGVGDVRPVGTGAPASAQGTISLTACSGIDVTGTQFPTLGSPILPFPAENDGVCSPAAPTLPSGEPPLPVCNRPPVADGQTVTTDEDTPVTITLTGSDPDSNPLTFLIVTPPAHGSLGPLTSPTATSVQVVYTPAPDYNGPDSFTFQVDDGNGGTSTATVTISVTSVNDAPNVNAATFTLNENSPNGTAVGTVTFTDPDVGQNHTFAITAGNTGGAFAINSSTGQITVANSAAVDFETTPTFSLTVQVTDDGTPALSGTATITINLVNLNDPPVVSPATFSIPENSANGTSVGTVTFTDQDSGQAHTFAITAGNTGGAFAINASTGQITVANSAAVDFETTPVFTLTVQVTDNGSPVLSGTATITIHLIDVNETPVVNPATFTIDENSPNGTVVGSVTFTDPDAGQAHTFSITSGNTGGAFAINASGQITVANSAAVDFETTPTFTLTVQVTDNGTPVLSGTATVTIHLNDLNEAPVVNPATFAINEGSAVGTAVGTVKFTDQDAGQAHTFAITGGNTGGAFAINASTGAITVANIAPLDFETTPTFTLTVEVTDNGTPALSGTATITINLIDVNEAPVVNPATFAVDENSPLGTAVGTVTFTDPDSGQTHTFAIIAGNTGGAFAINSSTGAITVAGAIDYETLPAYSLTVRVTDSGTPALSGTATVTIAVNNLPEPPTANPDSFDAIGNTLLQVGAADTATGPHVFVTGSVLANDTDQDVPSNLTASLNTASPGAEVAVNSDGTFTYLPSPGATGPTDTFTYNLTDGTYTVTGTVTITLHNRVWFVKNDAVAGGLGRSTDPFDTLAEAQAASSANDYIFVFQGDGTSAGQDAGITLKAGQHLVGEHAGLSIPIPSGTFNGLSLSSVSLVTAVSGNRPLIDNTTAGGNAISITDTIPAEVTGFSLSGKANAIDLTTSAAFAGSGTFSIKDNVIRSAGAEGIDVNAGGTGTLKLGITGNSWDTAGTHVGNAVDINRTGGQLQLDFSNNTGILSSATAVSINGGAIASTTITGFASNTVHQNTGGTGISVANAKFDLAPGTAAYEQVNGGNTVIGISGNGVGGAGMVLSNVAGDLPFANLNIFADGGAGLRVTGTGAVNTGSGTGTRVTVGAGVAIIEATGGPVVDVTSSTIDLQLASLKSTTSPSTGVALNSVNGTFSAGSGSSISSTSGTAFQVGSSNATVSYAGTINTTTGAGVSLTNNTGSTISLTGTLTLSTGSNPAFVATGGGTVTSTDTASTLTTTTGTALNVANTTIGAGGLKFRSISANGGANGIVLDTTGANGGLTVTGSGSAGTGGTIRNMVGGDGAVAGSGIYLKGTSNVSLAWMQLNDFQNFAIRGTNVSGFTLTNSTINGVNGNNDVANEGSVSFDELTGSATLTNVNISGGWEDNFRLSNTTGTLNRLTLTNCNIGANSASFGNSALNLMASGTAVVKVTATGCTFTGSRSHHIQFLLNGNSTPSGDLLLTSNTFTQSMTAVSGAGNIFVSSGGNGSPTLTYNIQGNTMRNAIGNAINVSKGAGTGTFSGTIDSNIIGVTGVANSGSSQGNGIAIIHVGGGTHTTHITNNTIRRYNNDGILVQVGDNTSGGNGTVNATITGNTVKEPDSFALHGLELNIGTTAGDAHFVCASIGGAGALKNDVSGAGNTGNGGFDMRPRQRQSTTIRLPGYAGAATDTAAVATFLTGQNTLSTISASAASNGFVNGAACP